MKKTINDQSQQCTTISKDFNEFKQLADIEEASFLKTNYDTVPFLEENSFEEINLDSLQSLFENKLNSFDEISL